MGARDPDRAAEQEAATQQSNDAFVRQIVARMGTRQNEPAEQVFQNIQWLKGVRAGQLLAIMNQGYSRALGVACTHCHDEQDWASDRKRPKRAAREMAAMHRQINAQLAKMAHLATPSTANRAINCATCHRGATNPRGS
jgi:photosynthetic reaction center cytochrome c subunit